MIVSMQNLPNYFTCVRPSLSGCRSLTPIARSVHGPLTMSFNVRSSLNILNFVVHQLTSAFIQSGRLPCRPGAHDELHLQVHPQASEGAVQECRREAGSRGLYDGLRGRVLAQDRPHAELQRLVSDSVLLGSDRQDTDILARPQVQER